MALSSSSYTSSTCPSDVTYLSLYAPTDDGFNQQMYERFQSWALRNYGDSGKTKTVTRRKYNRIVRILTGEEPATTENSKFRFWVKGKGFRLGPVNPAGEHRILYVPTKMSLGEEESQRSYKRVAVVEDFFRIIYSVHVEMDGRGGKHAGQKRTYRAIAETYSFLPREAVTRFLMSCSDCQKRMHLTLETNNNSQPQSHLDLLDTRDPNPILDRLDLPMSTSYLQQDRHSSTVIAQALYNDEDTMSSASSQLSSQSSPSPGSDNRQSPRPPALKPETEMNGTTSPINLHKDGMVKKEEEGGGGGGGEDKASPPQQQPPQQQPSQQQQHVTSEASSLADSNGSVHEDTDDIKPLNMMIMTSPAARSEVKGHNDRKRRASSDSLDSLQTKASESAADDASKDDDEENDDDDDEKMSSSHDPERLKAFNMFVRLFVDENLDRIVPISKQPKDKIQAILDACDRQFPEFHERSRKRIRTYLKSCRRMRRSKDTNGWDQLRPTPPHLTSAAAESILAMACENESNNAKRMRMGLEPLPMSAMVSSQSAVNIPTQPVSSACASPTQAPPVGAHAHGHQPPCLEKQTPSIGSFRAAHELPSPFITNSNGVFRPTFTNNYHNTGLATHIQNGPTDLSMKKPSLSSPSSKNQLNSSEVAAIRQLIAGYRESAAFLYRSADELEQLLLHQN